jgi:type II secretory pathway component PulJ
MKCVINSKKGSSMVEVVVAIAIFTIMATAIVAILFSSRTVSEENLTIRKSYESTVGRMDSQLEGELSATPAGGGSTTLTDVSVSVKFPTDSSATSVDCQKAVDGTYGGVGIVKAK